MPYLDTRAPHLDTRAPHLDTRAPHLDIAGHPFGQWYCCLDAELRANVSRRPVFDAMCGGKGV